MPTLLWRLRLRRWLERMWIAPDLMLAYYRREVDT
jgi:hypothetical protein